MTKQLCKEIITTYKTSLLALAGLELLHSLLLLATAWQFSGLVANVYQHAFTDFPAAAPVLLALFLMLCLQPLASFQQRRIIIRLSASWRETCRLRLHQHAPHTATSPAALSLQATETVDRLDHLLSKALPVTSALLFRTPVILAAALAADPLTALLFALTLPIAPFLLYLIGQATKTASSREWHRLQQLNAGFDDMLRSMMTWKLFAQEQAQRQDLRTLSQGFAQTSLQVLKLAFASSFALELITTLSIAIVAVSTGLRLLDNALAFRTALLLLLLAPEFYQPLRQGGIIFHAAIESLTAWQKLQAFVLAPQPAAADGHHEQLQLPPAIHLQDIRYRYPGTKDILLGLQQETFPAHKISVITGPSGCGKSTLLKLLAGLLPPDQGLVLLNDQPLATMAAASRQKLIAYVPQQPHLYAASLQENVSLFQEVPAERIRQALRLASLDGLLHRLPAGLDTKLGGNGLPLSQGERKRLGLARALLQNRPVTLLDEPTAGMDEALEQQIIRALTAFAHRRTLVIISHHPAIQAIADKIIHLAPYPTEGADRP